MIGQLKTEIGQGSLRQRACIIFGKLESLEEIGLGISLVRLANFIGIASGKFAPARKLVRQLSLFCMVV